MDEHRKHQVSLRGASAKEISRDALLEKVAHQRELRNYARQASSSALFIQRVWRRYNVTKKEAQRLREEWESTTDNNYNNREGLISASWISTCFLRPFLFFVHCLSIRSRLIRAQDIESIRKCLMILLESVNSNDSRMNFCSLALGTPEERRTWTYQSRKLVSLCLFILAECGQSHASCQDAVVLTSLAMRFLVLFTDPKGWKSVNGASCTDADVAVRDLVRYLGSCESGLYVSVRAYIMKLDVPLDAPEKTVASTDEKFLITASAISLAIRPFQVTNFDSVGPESLDLQSAPAQYCLFILTISWLTPRLPAVLLPALKHKSVLLPCFLTLLVLGNKILSEMSKMDRMKNWHPSGLIPLAGWALANVICLAAGNMNDFVDHGGSNQDLYYALYVRLVIVLSDNLLSKLHIADLSSGGLAGEVLSEGETCVFKTSYMQLFWPVCQQWHLLKLLGITKVNVKSRLDAILPARELNNLGKLELLDIAHFYSTMLIVYSALNHTMGSLPVLNILSFSPGFITTLWEALEGSLFFGNSSISTDNHFGMKEASGIKSNTFVDKKQKQQTKDGSKKWANVLNKIAGKSQAGLGYLNLAEGQASSVINEEEQDVWDVQPLRCGPQKLSKDVSRLLHLFCATYSHLLLVLDDIEFYDKQVPFLLEQQRRIASVLNTLVYNGAANAMSQQNDTLMESAIRCLHLLYERDCRHAFCPPALWLSPARKSRPPIAVAARTHEILLAQMKSNDLLTTQCAVSVITATPHVYPFDERVQMFREFINMDKVSRRMAGEVTGPGSRTIEIVVRRGHIVEDGFRQLNSLGSRLKSSIHVSFVSECGLSEAGLDYGGLSKEFLTDISKTAFSPEYGLFVQTSTSERLLTPNPAARYLDNGVQMIEFLGRIVGKALYEGILLDYSFSHVFVQKLLGRYSFLDELSTLDPELYRNLMYVKHYDGDAEELFLDFTVIEEAFGKRQVIELKHGGKDVSVKNENKMQYVHAMADYKLNRQILPFSNAFYRGLSDLISPSWLKLFNASEFNQLLSGGELNIDVDDLQKNTRYSGGYSEGSRTIRLFWEVMGGFEPKERCMLLKFVTSCSRAPLLGFKHLQPSFTIHKVACDSSLWASIGGQDVERLPSASTCYNTLKLPTYKRASTLRAKLLYAISSNTGFELS